MITNDVTRETLGDEFIKYVSVTQRQIDNERGERLRDFKIRERVMKGEAVPFGFNYDHLSGYLWVPGFLPFRIDSHAYELTVYLVKLNQKNPKPVFKVRSTKGTGFYEAVPYSYQYSKEQA